MPVTEPLLPASIYADRLERLRARMEDAGLRPHRRVGRSRAQRQHRLPDRVRPTVRRGGAHRRAASERSGDPARQRVLRPGRGGAAADATGPVPGPQPARPVARPIASRCPRSCATRASGAVAGSGSSAGRRTRAGRRSRLPAFLVDELRRATGAAGLVENATDLLIDPADGLRVINEVEQLAAFEWAACQTSPACAVC